jgi:para-nitrobenzyl esterase
MRAFHSAELFFVFGNLSKIYYAEIPYTPSADEVALSNQLMDYWTHFAATGDPNGVGKRPWLPYDAKHDNIFQLDVTKGTIDGYHNDRCDYLDSLPLPGVGVPPIVDKKKGRKVRAAKE